MRYLTLFLLLFFITTGSANAQKVMLMEKVGASTSQRIFEGQALKWRMKGDKFWQQGVVTEMREDIQALIIKERFIFLDEIDAIHLGDTFGKIAGYSIMTFGASYTIIGLIGYNTDKDPETQISSGELMVGAGSLAAGFLIKTIFGDKKFRLGKNKRLRIIDISF